MDRSRAKELLPVITAYAEGKDIEFTQIGNDDEWSPVPDLIYRFEDDYKYRIKPEPEEYWFIDGLSGRWLSLEEAKTTKHEHKLQGKIFHVKEVIE